ncbi:MAG: FxLYD domain-containing protein [Candidatus Thermoplasmatota archaeon]|nr:FxLYD domain-containing protein [Candidatus Thermoplasmatota archaeon]MCG2827244.1 FxLYD domain-containing protein [Thermoplasmatales archaeon]
MKKQLILSVGTFLVVALILLACGDTTEYGEETAKTAELEILESNMNEEYGWAGLEITVTGVAKNIGEEQLSWAEVKVKWYDANGTLLGTDTDSIQDLDAGESWNFEVPCIAYGFEEEDVASYKIAVGSCW